MSRLEAPRTPVVAHPVMHQQWRRLVFLHWRYPVEAVQRLLPPGLAVQPFDGSAWVGLVPFLMAGVRAPGVPALPWLSEFPETNVRTYVQDDRGRTGIWFLSLDAARLPAVLAARTTYRLPYFWSAMSVTAAGRTLTYRSRRRWPGPGPACAATVHIGRPLSTVEYDEHTHFLTGRHHLFTVIAGRLAVAEAEHAPWPLWHADLAHLDQTLLPAGATGDPLLHASAGVVVRIGRWHR